jgi:hypothetical protein
MNILKNLIVFAIALFAGVQPATAGKKPIFKFQIDGLEFTLPIPKGFCLPSGPYALDAQQIALADAENETHVIFYTCKKREIIQNGATISVKTIKSLLHVDLDDEKFNTLMGDNWIQSFDSNKTEIDQNLDKSIDRAKSQLGFDINFKNEIRPFGKDRECRYLAGAFEVSSGDQIQTIYAGACLSTISGRSFSFYRYERALTSKGSARILADVKALRNSMKGVVKQN